MSTLAENNERLEAESKMEKATRLFIENILPSNSSIGAGIVVYSDSVDKIATAAIKRMLDKYGVQSVSEAADVMLKGISDANHQKAMQEFTAAQVENTVEQLAKEGKKVRR